MGISLSASAVPPVGPPGSGLYGAEGGASTSSDLYQINPGTGAGTSIGPLGYALTALACRPSDGVMFGVTSNNSPSPKSLVTVNLATGAATIVGSLAITQPLTDLAFRSDDVLYGWHGSNYRLHTVDTSTGAATAVSILTPPGGSGKIGMGCTFDSADVLYFFPEGDAGPFYSVDEATPAFTSLGTLSGSPVTGGRVSAAAADATDIVYVALLPPTDPAHLAIVDLGTGVIMDVGETLNRLDALAWAV